MIAAWLSMQTLALSRDYACEHCGKNGTYAEITQVHDAQCDLKLVPCPACSAIIARN